jgi:hypothetical protein
MQSFMQASGIPNPVVRINLHEADFWNVWFSSVVPSPVWFSSCSHLDEQDSQHSDHYFAMLWQQDRLRLDFVEELRTVFVQ